MCNDQEIVARACNSIISCMRKSTFNYIAFYTLILLAIIIANGAAWTILLSSVDDDDDGPAIVSIKLQDDHQFLPSLENIQQSPQSTFQPCIVSIRELTVPVSAVQNPFFLSTRD